MLIEAGDDDLRMRFWVSEVEGQREEGDRVVTTSVSGWLLLDVMNDEERDGR